MQILETDRLLDEVAKVRGPGSQATRTTLLRGLFARSTTLEREFLIRLLLGDLRQGALAGVMVDAIAFASGVPLPDVRRAVMYAGNLGAVARVALLEGSAPLEQFQLAILSPIAPMLAQTAADVADALQQLEGDVAFDWKMDGARIQVHRSEDAIRVYTRNLNEVTTAVPEIVETIRALPVRDLILDGEAIAYNADGRPHPFQVTMRRFGRKLAVDESRASLPLQAFFFDCLRSDGRSLVDRPARERFAAMASALPESLHIPRLVTRDVGEARAFYEAALAAGHEGVMAKSLDAPYEAGNRGAGWLKIKRAHTLDLVVLAAEWGHGRRAGKLSNLHLGALDPATGEYVMLGKTFKGLTDSMLEWQTRELLAREVATRRGYGVRSTGAGRRDRVQRSPGESAVSRRSRLETGARQALSRRQACAGRRYDGVGAPDLRLSGLNKNEIRPRSRSAIHREPACRRLSTVPPTSRHRPLDPDHQHPTARSR